ncbi:BatD family protein [Parabacteroides sp. AM08-6]|uniref:BatD family protein n=1 Tax=Parabacteroides sp. AM08-6 TaxID=2292053 RepID=UPI000EFF219B|nr:BatD family protein [Parabacteroides sp. AM08-6]RHJ83566.1 protein BatD [Parabacteroides sp. AM08-6]
MRKLVFLFVFFSTIGITAKAADITFKASAPEVVVMGETFKVSYTVNGEGKDIRIPEIPDFEILMGPSPTVVQSTEIDNGNASFNVTTIFTYVLMPKKEGTFNIPPATIKVKGSNYTSNALAIKVLPPEKSDEVAKQQNDDGSVKVSNDDVFLKIDVSNRNVYEQEGILVTFKLYTRYDLNIQTPPKFPEFDGFLTQEIELSNLQWKPDSYKDKRYNSVVIKQVVLYPQRSGKITIPSGKMDVLLRLPAPRKSRPRSIFDLDGFLDSYQNVNKILTTPPVTIDVKPLPSGKPASFGGAVGNFNMTSSINSTNVKTDEAVTIKVNITGNGNIKLVKNPEVVFPNDFEVYDPKVNVDVKTTTAGASGTKSIEYMAIPRYAGDFEIPAIAFSYFDPKSGAYKTISSEPYKLHVEQGKGGNGNAPVVSNYSNKESVKFLGKDIRYLKMNDIHFLSNNDIFFGSFMYILCYLVPAILFIVFFVIYRKQVKENSDLALVRTKKANKMAVRRLKNAGKLLKENKKEEFYDEVLRALWGYLSDKLNIPQANLTKDNMEAELTKYGVDQALINEFMDILNTCEFARYAPAQALDAMDKLYELTVDAIGKMENTIKK